MNWKLERKWKTLNELKQQIDLYFESNEKYSVEMLYLHLGISKDNAYDWANRGSPSLKKRAEMIQKAKDAIHSDLAHEIKNANHQAKSQMLYMKNRFKDDLLEEAKVDTNQNITITFGNEGRNSIE